MTTLAQFRKTALSLAQTAEHVLDLSTVAFTVSERRFAALSSDNEVQLHLPPAEADEFLTAYPMAQPLAHRATVVGVRIRLKDIDGQQLNHWVRRAWVWCAPKRLAAQATAAEAAAAGAVGDLPKAIGGPATRALVGAGITTLAQVAQINDTELLAMHGVGPKAVRILREALTARHPSQSRKRPQHG